MKFNIRFNLFAPSAQTAQKIYMTCRWTTGTEIPPSVRRKMKYTTSANRFVYPSHFSVLPKNWDKKTGRVKNTNAEPLRMLINNHLEFLRKSAYSLYGQSISENILLTKEFLKKGMDTVTGKTITAIKLSLLEFIEKYIAESENRTNPKTGLKISYRSIQEYNTTLKNIREFQEANEEPLDWADISINTFKDFRDYLTAVKNYAVNNTAKHVDNFRQFLREAHDEKFIFDYSVLTNKKIIVTREEAVNVALNEEELKRIENLKLVGIKDKVRDLFMVSCWTGLRISDFTNIQSYNIKHRQDGDYLEIFQKKTGGKVVIPCFEIVMDILKKWNDVLPSVSDQKINMHIKEICKEAGIDEAVEKQQTKGGKKLSIVSEKWQFVTAHTGRRSFCTNMVRRGYPIKAIMHISGHKKENVFLKYVVLSPMEYAMLLNKSILATGSLASKE
jgi:integrase